MVFVESYGVNGTWVDGTPFEAESVIDAWEKVLRSEKELLEQDYNVVECSYLHRCGKDQIVMKYVDSGGNETEETIELYEVKEGGMYLASIPPEGGKK